MHRVSLDKRVRLLAPKGAPLVDHSWLDEPRGAFRDRTLEAFREVVVSELVRRG